MNAQLKDTESDEQKLATLKARAAGIDAELVQARRAIELNENEYRRCQLAVELGERSPDESVALNKAMSDLYQQETELVRRQNLVADAMQEIRDGIKQARQENKIIVSQRMKDFADNNRAKVEADVIRSVAKLTALISIDTGVGPFDIDAGHIVTRLVRGEANAQAFLDGITEYTNRAMGG